MLLFISKIPVGQKDEQLLILCTAVAKISEVGRFQTSQVRTAFDVKYSSVSSSSRPSELIERVSFVRKQTVKVIIPHQYCTFRTLSLNVLNDPLPTPSGFLTSGAGSNKHTGPKGMVMASDRGSDSSLHWGKMSHRNLWAMGTDCACARKYSSSFAGVLNWKCRGGGYFLMQMTPAHSGKR
ncbi:hypothetical protein ACTXT7_009253 [Hymenolepis weldensis]